MLPVLPSSQTSVEMDMEIHNYNVMSVLIWTYPNCCGSKEKGVSESEEGGEGERTGLQGKGYLSWCLGDQEE